MSERLLAFAREEEGATAIEYGVIAAMMFLVILGAVSLFGANAAAMWNDIGTHVQGASSP